MNQSDTNDTTVNGNLPLSPIETSESMRLSNDEPNTNTEFSDRNLMNVTINLNQVAMQRSDTSSADSPTTGGANDIGELAGVSPSTSLIVNLELSPEVATFSPLSSPITSKDSPLSPPSSATDGENMQAEMNELRLLIENPSRYEKKNNNARELDIFFLSYTYDDIISTENLFWRIWKRQSTRLLRLKKTNRRRTQVISPK